MLKELSEEIEEYRIALNFLRIEQSDFDFAVYAVEKKHLEFTGAYRPHVFRLPSKEGSYVDHWVDFISFDESNIYECSSKTNFNLTKRYIENCLITNIKSSFAPEGYLVANKFSANDNRTTTTVTVFTESHPEGKEGIVIRPYYMDVEKSFGFLINYKFLNNHTLATRRVQQLSLSLDSRGLSNKDFYIDILGKMRGFLKSYFDMIFSHTSGFSTSRKLLTVDAASLDERAYIIGNDIKVSNPFLGLKQKGAAPLKTVEDSVLFYFLYEQGEGYYAKSLLEGLKGNAFPNVFSGIEDFFQISNDTKVKASYLRDWSENEINEKIAEIKSIQGSKVITIAILPPKESPDNKPKYNKLKYYFTNAKLPIQMVTKNLISNPRTFEYSVANIGLQVFCKLGGYPWKVEPSNDNCLIVGLGQAYSEEKLDEVRVIKKQLAYSVLTDSSGIFRSIDILANSGDTKTYLHELEKNLLSIISSASTGFSKVAIHSPFKLNKFTIERLSEKCLSLGIELVVLVINDKNDFFGFHTKSNTLIPYESSYVKISGSEYLLWFEGLKKNNPKVSKRVPGPIYIKFLHHSSTDFSEENKMQYLQDCINLSGANWKGFKAKNVPVSMYYCQEIAKFLKNFEELGLNEMNFENDFPWFL